MAFQIECKSSLQRDHDSHEKEPIKASYLVNRRQYITKTEIAREVENTWFIITRIVILGNYKGFNTWKGRKYLENDLESVGNQRTRNEKSPPFKGQNYDYWKQRMMAFFDACHIDMSRDSKIFVERRIEDKDTLALAYEGASHVKDSKISMLVRKYELFKMEDNETIDIMFERFQTIINNLILLGKSYNNYDHIKFFLRSLARRWRPQVIALRAY
ncbi:hypothetical protein CR513_23677, partial [Mucuna pruriens]